MDPVPSASAPRKAVGDPADARRVRPAVGVLVNARSRRGGDLELEQGLDVLRAANLAVDVVRTSGPDHMLRVLRSGSASWGRVVLAGGDGTLHAALPALLDRRLPLGVIPMGTANDFARNLELPTDVEEACRVVAEGRILEVDVGEVNGRPFLNVASIGLGVEVTRRLSADAKKRWGALSYPRALADAVRATRSFSARIHCGDEERLVRSIQVAVGNGRFYGGGVPIADDATIDDQQLDLYSIEPQPLHRLLLMAVAVRTGRQRAFDHVVTMRGPELRVETSRPMRVSVDGELDARTPAHFRVRPGALRVFVPQEAEHRSAPGVDGGERP